MNPKIKLVIVAQIGVDLRLGASIRVPIDDIDGRLAIVLPWDNGSGHCNND